MNWNSPRHRRIGSRESAQSVWITWSLGFLLAWTWGARAADDTAAERLLIEGRAALRAGRMPEARKAILEAVRLAPNNAHGQWLLGQWHAAAGNGTNAVSAFGQALRLNPELAPAYQWRGLELFKLGQVEKAIADFDEFLKREPGQEPHHWQRGIAYYYAGRFADGRRQFELHQTVNPEDVENAVWHFLCVARDSRIEEARAKLIPITGDRRVPMAEVHALFQGRAAPEAVLTAAEGVRGEGAAGRDQAMFYAHLYLGLYYEALKQEPDARQHMLKAAALSGGMGYMGAVARVHASRRGWN